MRYVTCCPAYGRDYSSARAVRADWDDGKDFQIVDVSDPDCGRYLNKEDARPGTTYNIRYGKQTKVLPIKVA